ncbi:hypothetical protein PMZ80_004927 [Knufia obscura]|uniref:Vacuolar protein 14 C-terminal Fig4-binding domain-containing protein n=1 Tax=Knufia obscura TaxID=1635080 RepID=A0ABR0RQ55_9EURO|nr:hypothetical protein PMZ80_004927 [Knufia obscura]
MDANVQRLLTDKLYDKRKSGALELEKLIRDSLSKQDHDRIRKVVDQLCHEYAYAVHLPHARNGGLIGLAAASIALGSDEVARYLPEIVPPVLACFTDQDARVRYYACEAMYNISKVAKGEVLVFFNLIFDSLCKVMTLPAERYEEVKKLKEKQLSGDSELSVKNGAELLDRLIKDIVSESAAHYVSILNFDDRRLEKDRDGGASQQSSSDMKPAFSLADFIPLLEERIHVINPFTRQFLVAWLSLLDTIPDLELVHYLPSFLGGLLKFLGDQNRDVYIATQGLLERLLAEIVKIAKIKNGIAESRRSRRSATRRRDSESQAPTGSPGGSIAGEDAVADGSASDESGYEDSSGDWIPGQDVEIDHAAILDILLKFVDPSSNKDSSSVLRLDGLSKQKEEEIGIVALRWIATFFAVASGDILAFVPRLLGQVLPALASQSEQFRAQAASVNRALIEYVVAYQDNNETGAAQDASPKEANGSGTATSAHAHQKSIASIAEQETTQPTSQETPERQKPTDEPGEGEAANPERSKPELDYTEAVRVLQLQLLHEREETRVATISWLRLLHRKAPRKVLALNDGTFPVLLKTLSDPAEAVVTQDLQLLSQLSKNSEDNYFSSFMVALLQLFSTDRKLLEIRGNLIIRQLCISLRPERIYRTFADCIEKDEDIEFSSIMVQNLNNNLITAPELAELRKRLRNLDTKDGQAFFVALFKAWSHNAVATVSLCLLAQAYEQAYSLLQIFADLEMTVNMLIQIDKLVQLLESPVFTFLRIQLLEPEKYPYLYKCLYGLLMLLPQSSAFAALKNRLNSVSAIALLHTPPPMPTSARPSYVSTHSTPASNVPSHVRQLSVEKGLPLPLSSGLTNLPFGSLTSSAGSVAAGSNLPGSSTSTVSRLSGRREPGSINTTGEVKWSELLDKFKGTQEKARRRNERLMRGEDGDFETEIQKQESKIADAMQEVTGRNSRASGRQSVDLGRPGSRMSIERGQAGLGIRQPQGTLNAAQQRPGFRTERPFDTPSASEQTRPAPKSKYSLSGKFGIRGSSRDKERDKDKYGGSGAGFGGSGLKR